MLDRAQEFTSRIDFNDYERALSQLHVSDGFREPHEGRLRCWSNWSRPEGRRRGNVRTAAIPPSSGEGRTLQLHEFIVAMELVSRAAIA